jgi:tripartite-type tricarboxylate transporter receptor subunit TctC
MTIARDLVKPAIWLSLFLVGCGVYTGAFGASYPNRPITLVLPFPPGGPAGVVADIVAPELGQRLEQKVVIENHSGADGIIGSEFVTQAPPDGYTLLLTTNSHVIHPAT